MPLAKVTLGELGSFPRSKPMSLNRISPVNGSASSPPATGEAKSTMNVQVPGTGSVAYSDSCRRGDSTGTPLAVNPVVR